MELGFYYHDGKPTVLSQTPVDVIPEKGAVFRRGHIASGDMVTLSHARARGAVERSYLGVKRLTPEDQGVRLPVGAAAVSRTLLPPPEMHLGVVWPSEAQGPGDESEGLNIWFELVAPLNGPPGDVAWPTSDGGASEDVVMSIRVPSLFEWQGGSYLGRDMRFYPNPAVVEGRDLQFFVHMAHVKAQES